MAQTKNADGTVDVTNLVNLMRSSFILSQVNGLFAMLVAVQGFGWLALPVIRDLVKKALDIVVTKVASSAEAMAFFENTALRKAWQANDYIEAINRKQSLPHDASDEELEHAEKVEMATFRNFVRVTN